MTMDWVLPTVAAIVGLFVGSAIWTVARNQAARRPLFNVSPCDLEPDDGPMAAWQWLPFHGFGRARPCGDETASPWRVPFELAVAAYYAVATAKIDDRIQLVAALVCAIPLLVILLVDLWTRLIHMNVIAIGIIAGVTFSAFAGFDQLWRSLVAMLAAALVFGGLFFAAALIYRNTKIVPFGLGDVYLAAMIGAIVRLGDVTRALIYGIFLAGATAIVLLATKRIGRRQAIAYGPYLCLGALVVLLTQS